MMTTGKILSLLACGWLAACLGGPGEPDGLRNAQARWKSNRPERFGYKFTRSCFCPRNRVGPFLVEASRDSVLRARRLVAIDSITMDTLLVESGQQGLSIDSIFQEIAEVLRRDPEIAEVRYNGEFGYPERANFDISRRMLDEELTLTVEEFRTLP